MKMRVIDVSKHNGKIDFAKVKASGVDGVIIRAGYGKSITQKDERFEENYRNATAQGLYVGAYWYSYAETVDDAALEASCFSNVLSGKKFSLPVYLDIEEKASQKNAAMIVGAFCEHMEQAGYFVGVYASKSYIESYIGKAAIEPYSVWVAQWETPSTSYNLTQYGMWQYSAKGNVPGISGYVDLDYCYVDYPAIIIKSRLNGWDSDTNIPPEKLVETGLHEIVVTIDGKEVYRGLV